MDIECRCLLIKLVLVGRNINQLCFSQVNCQVSRAYSCC